jgi:autotransporter-associated beta strand protein
VISSSDAVYGDAKMAMDNARRAIDELKQRGVVRKSKFTSSGPDAKPAVSKKLKDIEDDVEKQIEEQGILITSNIGNLSQLETKARVKAQIAPQAGKIEVLADNTWTANPTASKPAAGPQMVANLQGQTFFNDFVCVDNSFLGKPATSIVKSGAGTMMLNNTAGVPVTVNNTIELTANSNSRAAQTLQIQQGAQMDAPQIPQIAGGTMVVPPGSINPYTTAGGFQISGANTYTGVTTLNAGTLTLNALGRNEIMLNGEQMLQQAKELAKNGRYDDSRQLALSAANAGAGNSAVEFMKRLDDVDRYEPALSPKHVQNVQEVERQLQLGYSYYNLGDYDRSNKSFQEVLRVDPYNSAARRGMERAEQKRSEYFDAARDQTRAKMLNEVNRGWESAVPNQFVDLNAPVVRPPNGLIGGWAQVDSIEDPRTRLAPAAGAPATAPVLPGTGQVTPAAAPMALPPILAQTPPTDAPPAQPQVEGFWFNNAAALMTPQLKPVGRVSLAVDVPLSGNVFHFSKLKDHAALEVTVVEPWQPREKGALWTLLGGVVLFGGIGWLRRKR